MAANSTVDFPGGYPFSRVSATAAGKQSSVRRVNAGELGSSFSVDLHKEPLLPTEENSYLWNPFEEDSDDQHLSNFSQDLREERSVPAGTTDDDTLSYAAASADSIWRRPWGGLDNATNSHSKPVVENDRWDGLESKQYNLGPYEDLDKVVPSFMHMRLTSTPPPRSPDEFEKERAAVVETPQWSTPAAGPSSERAVTLSLENQRTPNRRERKNVNAKLLQVTNQIAPWSMNDLRGYVREHFDLLAKIYTTVTPGSKKLYPVAHPLQVQTYQRTRNPDDGPTLEDFAIDMEQPKSEWNKRLAAIFPSSFRRAMKKKNPVFSDLDDDLLADIVLTRIKGIREAKKVSDKGKSHQQEAECTNNQKQRKRSLSQRRYDGALWAAARDPTLKPLLEFLEGFRHTVECMSDDESDHIREEERGRHYWVHQLEWRSPQLTYIFRLLDCFHIASRFQTNGRATRGAWPHPRTESETRVDHSEPPAGLPANFYNPVWLATKTDWYKTQLMMEEPVEFHISADLLRTAQKYRPKLADKNAPLLPENHPDLVDSQVKSVTILSKSLFNRQ